MSKRTFSMRSDSYLNNVFNQFTYLQQEEDFVDLTLAADGHIVKVHKNIVAVASPYLKEMIKTVPCQSPVIFLNNVSYITLGYLIAYIYTGEVDVAEEHIKDFLRATKSLHIKGLDCLGNVPVKPTEIDTNKIMDTAAHIDINDTNNIDSFSIEPMPQSNNIQEPTVEPVAPLVSCPQIVTNFQNNIPKYRITINPTEINNTHQSSDSEKPMDYESVIDTMNLDKSRIEAPLLKTVYREDVENCNNSIQIKYLDNVPETLETIPVEDLDKIDVNDLKNMSQYSVTERGALQIVLNRYIYCCHHSSRGGRKRRWRCIDYRRSTCQAYIDTVDGTIVRRIGLHCHEFHDVKIYAKHERGLLFNSIVNAEAASKKLSNNLRGSKE